MKNAGTLQKLRVFKENQEEKGIQGKKYQQKEPKVKEKGEKNEKSP